MSSEVAARAEHRSSSTSAVDPGAYRNGMARLAAAVNIVTSVGPDGPCGFTASAVCSVTDSPPTLLVCINRSTQSYAVMVNSGRLAVNTLGPAHEALGVQFAGGVKIMAKRFEGARWSTAISGSPLLEGALVAFDCRIAQRTEIGTHDVFVCEVLTVVEGPQSGGSLVYVDRKFRSI